MKGCPKNCPYRQTKFEFLERFDNRIEKPKKADKKELKFTEIGKR